MNPLIEKILSKMNEDGSFGDPMRFYTDKYKGTIWNLIILAELGANSDDERVKKICEFVLKHSYDYSSGGFSVTYSKKFEYGLPSKVIPCLTGNMVFSLIRLGYLEDERVQNAIEWIVRYQRTDDGEYLTPVHERYKKHIACFSTHSCHMGVVKSLKALAEIPKGRRSKRVMDKISELTEFMLVHHIYKRSHDLSKDSKPGWKKFGFPLMYQTDILEIMDIFRRLEIKDKRMNDALKIIRSKSVDGRWKLETTMNGKTLVDIEQKGEVSIYLTQRAKEVLEFYNLQ